MWSTVGVIIAFVAIIVLVTRKVPLGYALLAGSLIAALSSGHSLWQFAVIAGRTLTEPGTVSLVATLVFISVLGSLMKELGILDKMVDALQKVLRKDKLTIMVIPSIMGVLPVTGGAIMSAPMVDALGDRLRLSGERKAAINLLYRHAWHFIFPFSPAFVLIREIADVDINRLILIQLPLTVVAVLAGYFALLGDVQEDGKPLATPTKADYLEMLYSTSPIWSSFILALVFNIPFHYALMPGLILALYYGKAGLARIPRLLLGGVQMPIVLSGVGIMVFKEVLASAGTLGTLTDGLIRLGLPLEVIVILLPAVVGLISGSATSAVGITLPILLPALRQSGHLILFCAGSYAASYLGYFLSPLHLCQVLTLEFFRVKVNQLYRVDLLPVTAMWLTLFLIVWVGRWF